MAQSNLMAHTDFRHRGRLLVSLLAAFVASGAFSTVGPAEEPSRSPAASAIEFARDVYPVFRRACFECHGEKRQEADLRLDQKQFFAESWTVEPGDAEASELVRRVELPRGHDEVMPQVGEPLTQREVAVIRRWINAGAVWPDNFEQPPHWAYVAPVRPQMPHVSNPDWARSAIDRFVLAQLDAHELTPSPPARPGTLLRRVYLDLIGLPPTPREVVEFTSNPTPEAYACVVDDLLARPEFGQRWARHWLDLARYADSHGFQRDNFRDIWAYRDWVIAAMNGDMPFDQFTIEQLAGDLLPGATESQRIATGFHRCAPTNVEAGSLPEETRVEQVIDRVNTTATVWLGSTLECAQCHDHKFDPFTAKDYYRLLAFFNSTQQEADLTNPKVASSIQFQGPSMPLSNPSRDAERSRLESEREQLEAQRTHRRQKLVEQLAEAVPRLTNTSTDQLPTAGVRVKQLMQAAARSPEQHPIRIAEFASRGTTDEYQVRDDGAVLLVGEDPPATDVYTFTGRVDQREIRAIRLDVLTDDSLPGGGPGRGDPIRTNFVLNDFKVTVLDGCGARAGRPLQFASAIADFSQNQWDVSGAIDRSPKTGWAVAPQFGKPHWAMFVLDQPLDATGGVELRFELHQSFGQSRTIGCFRVSAVTGEPSAMSIPANIAGILRKDPQDWTQQELQKLADYLYGDDAERTRLDQRLKQLDDRLAKLEHDTTLVMIELDQPRPTHVFERGDYRSPGEPVTPGTPAWLHSAPAVNSSGLPDRLTLARWLVDPANPLVARVTVNRWWAEIFGAGIVRTPEDFGIKGEPPTHPELLDWLAVELMENKWSMKHIIRTIVLSSTYQQSSVVSERLAAIDDQNRLLARGPRFRMSAEMIRDNALAISGLLSLKQSGAPVRPYQPAGVWSKVGGTNYEYAVSPGEDAYRRGIYVVLKRSAPYPSFVNFDATARLACVAERSRTNTPLQALTLLNDPVYVEAAKAIAARAAASAMTEDLRVVIRDEFLRCTSRDPAADELRALVELCETQRRASQQKIQQARRLMSDHPVKVEVAAEDFAACYSVATVLLNLHETITKE